MLASLAHREPVTHLPLMVSKAVGGGEDLIWGQALKALRRRAGMTLAEAGDAAVPPLSGQGWGLYEQGQRTGIHLPKTQARLTRAVSATPQDLAEEARRLGADHPANENGIQNGVAEAGRTYVVPVLSRVRAEPDAHGGVVYDARQADSTVDMAWIFGPTAGRLRMGDDRLKGRVAAGQLIHYDKAQHPRAGQVCVIETKDGGLYVYEYQELAGGLLKVAQCNPSATVEFPMAVVRGVYAVRLVGD